jgi:phosphatidylserine/phosphatidylglycerophosphate/cardiolipin synthase-like enzyme
MYHNNAQCDIYIGTGAGKKLMEEMGAAQKSIKIVSPFLSADLVNGLTRLHGEGISVELITTESDNANPKLLQSLIQQEVHIDQRAKRQRNIFKQLLWGSYAIFLISFLVSWGFFVQKELRLLLYSVMAMAVVGLVVVLLRYLIRNTRVHSYSYHSIFPLRIIKTYDGFGKRTSYLHSKIYIIDDKVAYLGSLNFTRSGTKNNYETRVRLTDSLSVSKIVEEFHFLMDEADYPEVDFPHLGKQIFHETLN